jgi:hypothetical protein
MPLTETQQVWLDEKEKDRAKTSTEYAKKLVEEQVYLRIFIYVCIYIYVDIYICICIYIHM